MLCLLPTQYLCFDTRNIALRRSIYCMVEGVSSPRQPSFMAADYCDINNNAVKFGVYKKHVDYFKQNNGFDYFVIFAQSFIFYHYYILFIPTSFAPLRLGVMLSERRSTAINLEIALPISKNIPKRRAKREWTNRSWVGINFISFFTNYRDLLQNSAPFACIYWFQGLCHTCKQRCNRPISDIYVLHITQIDTAGVIFDFRENGMGTEVARDPGQ